MCRKVDLHFYFGLYLAQLKFVLFWLFSLDIESLGKIVQLFKKNILVFFILRINLDIELLISKYAISHKNAYYRLI